MFIEVIIFGGIICFFTYLVNAIRFKGTKSLPTVYFKDTKFHRELIEDNQQLRRSFIPTIWASNAHSQTWLKTIMSLFHASKLNVTREYLEMNDKGIISLDWVNVDTVKVFRKQSRPRSTRFVDRPILLIIPSSINTGINHYADLCYKAIKNGFKPVVFNRRGYSQTPLTTPKIATYCDTSDLHETLNYVTSQCPFSDIVAIGFSVESGNLISYLGNKGASSRIRGAVCVSSTFGCENLLNDHAMKQPYNFIITEKLKTTLLSYSVLELNVDFRSAKRSENIVELQGAIHARSNHYKTLKQYLEYNNPLAYLNKVSVPVLFINSIDDPVIPELCIPFPFFQISKSCILVTTESGGHCGFYQDLFPNCWSDSVAIDFLKSLLQKQKAVGSDENGVSRYRRMTTGSLYSNIGI